MNENRDRDTSLKNIDVDLKKINQTLTVMGKVIDKANKDLTAAMNAFVEGTRMLIEAHNKERQNEYKRNASVRADQGRDESVDNDGESFSDGSHIKD